MGPGSERRCGSGKRGLIGATDLRNLHLCTLVTARHVPAVRVWIDSLKAVHPQMGVTVAVVQRRSAPLPDLGVRVIDASELEVPIDEMRRLATIYPEPGLRRALVPALLNAVLGREAEDIVAWFDPSTRFYGALDPVVEAVSEHPLALAPRLLNPLPFDGCNPSEDDVRSAGGWDDGFVVVRRGRQTQVMLEWWFRSLRRLDAALPVYDRYAANRVSDLLPTQGPVGAVRDEGCAVSRFNFHERQIIDGAGPGNCRLVSGAPVAWVHFDSFDPFTPDRHLQSVGRRGRVSAESAPGLRRLCREYADELFAAGALTTWGEQSEWDRIDAGHALDSIARATYGEALTALESRVGERAWKQLAGEPPNPFTPGGEATFLRWLHEGDGTELGRYHQMLLAHRPDLQTAFGSDESTAERVRDWCTGSVDIVDECDPAVLAPDGMTANLRRRAAVRPFRGVNVVGYLDAMLGLGVTGRSVVTALEAANEPVVRVALDLHMSPVVANEPSHRGALPFDVTITTVNLDNIATVAQRTDWPERADAPVIAYWFWETDTVPASFLPAFKHIDEVWVASDFNRLSMEAAAAESGCEVPVLVVPHPIERSVPTHLTRADLGLSEGCCFTFVFDMLSRFERKNPLGLVEAYREAFSETDGALLCIKTLNGRRRPTEFEILLRAAQRSDIHVIDEAWPAHRVSALIQLSDAYVSLHRSEGLGLTIAEAMAAGRPVIATAWSGNLDLAPANCWIPVPFDLTEIPAGIPPYSGSGRWAEPDLTKAAQAIRRVAQDLPAASALGRRAQGHVTEACDPFRIGTEMKRHLDRVRSKGTV